MCHISHVSVTCHMPHVMCHMSHVTCHNLFFTKWLTYWTEGLLSTGLPRLVCSGPVHIVPHRKLDRIGGTPSATFPNFKYVAPIEICVNLNCFDSPIAK